MKKTITYGEIMGRFCLPNQLKFRQGLPGNLDLTFAGAEANVAASLSMLGCPAAFVTALPNNEITESVIGSLRNIDIDTQYIIKTAEGRLGTYYVEPGANQRPSKVIYDRSYSSVSLTEGKDYDWDEIFKDADWFHVSGVTPALSEISANAAITAAKIAKKHGVTVSCDLNFRGKLWNWEKGTAAKELCRKTMAKLLPYADIVIGNEQDADDVMGIKAGDTDTLAGKLDIAKYPDVAKQICDKYSNIKKVAITLRESISANHNNWGAMLYDKATAKTFFAPLSDGKYCPYEIKNIVDRIGGGDSFSAGLIYSLKDETLNKDYQKAINFAVAASCLCHSIYGDFNYSTKDEVLALANGDASGRVKR